MSAIASLKTLVPQAEGDLVTFLTKATHHWQGRPGSFHEVVPKAFPGQEQRAWIWECR